MLGGLLVITSCGSTPSLTRAKRTSDKGIYITSSVAQSSKMFEKIKTACKQSGINTFVIDAKWQLEKPLLELLEQHKLNDGVRVTAEPWLAGLTEKLHQEGFIVTARIVVFKDDHLVIARPDLGIKLPGGGIYRDHKGGRWANPFNKEVRLFNELIAERAALSGVDEIQFDYIRFPAEGAARSIVFPEENEDFTRVDAINSFLAEVKDRVEKYRVSLAVDIFGVTAWQSKTDIKNLGQDLKAMAKYLDVISPMLYPSHFHAGYDGFANPGSHPYEFMYSGLKRTQEILSQESVAIVPWIQGFNLRSPNYGPNYIKEQVRAAKELGIEKFLVWNASNNYAVTFQALRK